MRAFPSSATLLCGLLLRATCQVGVHAQELDTGLAGASESSARDKISQPHGEHAQRRHLLHEIVDVLRKSSYPNLDELRRSIKGDIPELEAALIPMFKTFPLNAGNRVCATGVRYILHRLLVQQHGWFVLGLDPEGRAWNSSSPAELDLLRQFPGVQALFSQRLEGDGLDVHEVSILAAMLEYLVHDEARQRLRAIYQKMGIETLGNVRQSVVDEAIDMYMASHISGKNPITMSYKELADELAGIEELFPTWPSTHAFVHDIVQRYTSYTQSDFNTAVAAVVEIGKRFGKKENTECQTLKNTLMQVEDRGTGRVRLGDFYGMALHMEKWNFGESIPYLRQLGALDETHPNNPRVIIPNYINGQSNCVASSQYYSVCCVSECEDLLQHLERSLGAPSAFPQDIVPLVQAKGSSTVVVPRSISTLMHYRLNTIAQSHGGKVPLHSRLFAQWLHYEYPRECPYPHLSGHTTAPSLTLEAWINETGLEPTASPAEMEYWAGKTKANWTHSRSKQLLGPVENMPWSFDEELIVPERDVDVPLVWRTLYGVTLATIAVVVALAMLLTRTARTARKALSATQKQPDKHYLV